MQDNLDCLERCAKTPPNIACLVIRRRMDQAKRYPLAGSPPILRFLADQVELAFLEKQARQKASKCRDPGRTYGREKLEINRNKPIP